MCRVFESNEAPPNLSSIVHESWTDALPGCTKAPVVKRNTYTCEGSSRPAGTRTWRVSTSVAVRVVCDGGVRDVDASVIAHSDPTRLTKAESGARAEPLGRSKGLRVASVDRKTGQVRLVPHRVCGDRESEVRRDPPEQRLEGSSVSGAGRSDGQC